MTCNGLTVYICIGTPARKWYKSIGIMRDGPSIRIGLAWIGVCLMWRDLEKIIGGVDLYVDALKKAAQGEGR